MIDFFFGNPRTGKTYKAMDYIYKEYLEENSNPKYNNIITNIGGFKFDKINQIFLDKGSACRAYKLVWKQFYNHLKEMHSLALEDCDDKELNDYAYNHSINDSLIVLDEASFYLKKYDDVISWWLAYHGHFKMQIIIITQGPKQIYAEYMSHTEVYYEAQAQIKQIKDNQLRYKHHHSFPFNKDSKFASSTITTKQEVYDLYKSGSIDKPKKIIYKYLALLGLGFLFFVFVIYSLFSRLSPDDKVVNDVNLTVENLSNNNIVSAPLQSQMTMNNSISPNNYLFSQFLVLSCNSSLCYNNDITLPIALVSYFVKNKNLTLLYTNEINQNYLKMYFSCSEDFYKFLISNKGVTQDEKKSNNGSFLSSFSSPAPSQSR